ncbi:ATP synthase F1 subunit delta [Marinoscillum furvescens]|uniref:ATP synthase subunit delta n=1 Tax=Marinoscillum furvescens DSM 4134 TaxID=1122208 RepID=A0A3D9L6A4_MARFU|nr:ATP synthase F1 subunit delta [Marinoscillum furvescens]REE00508.1 F-type H+-transporting ATPase subunit delta [Marinoscillum furvescens DSM 4134]
MSISRIAVRYATPLLELAEERKVTDAVKEDMASFSTLCESSHDFLLMLKSPIIQNLQKSEILKKIFDGKVNELTATFLDIVTKKNRAKFLPEIAKAFISLYNKKMGYQEAQVTTAVALDAELKAAFEKLVTEITGKKPLLTEKVNPELVGGYTLQLGDQQIDESVRGQLRDLQLKFQKETI